MWIGAGNIERLNHKSALLLVGVVLATGAGCGTSPGQPPPPTTTPRPVTTATATTAESAGAGCGGASAFSVPDPAAPAYAGPGPHLMVTGERGFPDADADLDINDIRFALPTAWQSYNDQTSDADLTRTQLVLCLLGLAKRGTTPVGTCQYDSALLNVYPATYTLGLFEVRTGRTVATFTIPSDGDIDLSCPVQVMGTPDIGQDISTNTLAATLKPYVLDDAR